MVDADRQDLVSLARCRIARDQVVWRGEVEFDAGTEADRLPVATLAVDSISSRSRAQMPACTQPESSRSAGF